jgi:flavin-dependent dehydrogenase
MTASAIVVGGGPAGLSAGIGLLRRGISTTILDQRTKWVDRVCGSFLNSESVKHLSWLGVENSIRALHPPAVRNARLTFPGGSSSIASLEQKGTNGIALPRASLEEALQNEFLNAGGRYETGARVITTKKLVKGWSVITNKTGETNSDILVLADGRFSINGGKALERTSDASGWYGWHSSFENLDQQPGDLSLHIYPGGYVGLLTFADGTTNVCGLHHKTKSISGEWEKVLAQAQDKNELFKRTMANGKQMSPWQGVGPLPYWQSMRPHNGVFLTKNTATIKDPFIKKNIGRTLNADPIIYKSIKSSNSLETYKWLWNKSYVNRLAISHWIRRSLTNPVLLPLASRLLYRNQRFINFATERFHVGYNAPAYTTYT